MKRAIICFTRVPKPGLTKTRLMPVLNGEQCARLHTAFLKDLSQLYQNLDADLFVAFAPDPDWLLLKKIFPTAKELFSQTGDDLGERMNNALSYVLSLGYTACILTGADLPLMTKAHIDSGFLALEEADITLGATSDGGYYLVGMKQPCPALFKNQTYGCSTVYENTIAAAKNAGYTVAPALTCDDIDTPKDLSLLTKTLEGVENHTSQYLTTLKKAGVILDS